MQPSVSLTACILLALGLPSLLHASAIGSHRQHDHRQHHHRKNHRHHRNHRVQPDQDQDQDQGPAQELQGQLGGQDGLANGGSSSGRNNGPIRDFTNSKPSTTEAAVPELPSSGSANLADEAGAASGSPTACPGCQRENRLQQLDNQLTQEEIRKMRLEIVKKQILEKLGLKKEPNVTRLPTLPEPLSQTDMILDDDPGAWESSEDDYYGKVTQLIVFGTEIRNCYKPRPAGCFHFSFKESLQASDVASATLWVYKLPDEGDYFNQTLMVQELAGPSHNLHPSRRLVAEKDTTQRIGWVKIDIKHTVRHWLTKKDRNRGLMVTCKTCYMDRKAVPIATMGDFKPFIVINASPPRRRRQRRSLGRCRPDIPQQPCCVVPFYVNFTEINMDSYILRPTGFYANYCQGTCSDSTLGTHMHTQAIQLLGKSTCCGATKLKSISILLLDEHDTAMFKKVNLPKMRLERCGCL